MTPDRDNDDDAWITRQLDRLSGDEADLGAALRARVLADHATIAASPVSGRRSRIRMALVGLAAGCPAALAGLWIGLSQPAAVIGIVSGLPPRTDDAPAATGEAAFLDDIFGTWEDEA